MPILVPDQERKFPLQQITLADYGIYDLLAQMINVKRANCPTWTDESASDLGMQLLWIFTVLSDLMLRTVNQQAKDCFLMTATEREAMRYLCAQLGYTIQEATAANVSITFTLQTGHPEFTIPAGTKVATAGSTDTNAVIFETITAQLVTVGTATVTVPCQQGETVSQEIVGSSDGTDYQQFYLSRRPVVWQSETVEVDEGSGFVEWTRVDNFILSADTDTHYRIELDNSGYYYICFGDGVYGKIPTTGSNNIRATYRRGGASAGNVAAGAITELLSSVTYVESVTNAAASSGGGDQENIARARQLAPATLRANDRIVTLADVQTLLASFVSPSYGTIAQSVAAGIDNLTIDVRFVPAIGGLPSTEFKAEVKAYLDVRRAVCTEIAVSDPTYYMIDYDVTIYVAPGYFAAAVVEQVRQAIVKFGSPNYRDANGLYPVAFGDDVSLGSLYVAILAVPGVIRAVVTLPAADIAIATTQIRDVNSIDIIAYEGNTSSSYLNLGTEL